MISLEKSVSTWQFPVNKVIKSRPCWEAPYLWLVTYWQLTLSDCFRKWWAEYRNTGAYSRCSLPFSPLSRFSPSPHPLPFLHLIHGLVSFGLAIFNGILTCNQAFLLPFSFWRLREKDAWYFKHCLSVVQNGQFQKISIPNHGRLPCLIPPLPLEIPKCVTPPCPQNSIIVNPPPLQNFRFFGSTFST